jgi:hypothetical protein
LSIVFEIGGKRKSDCDTQYKYSVIIFSEITYFW